MNSPFVVLSVYMEKEIEFKGDLPQVETKKSVRLHVAPGESACVSCEG